MTHPPQLTGFGDAIQLLAEHGFDGLVEDDRNRRQEKSEKALELDGAASACLGPSSFAEQLLDALLAIGRELRECRAELLVSRLRHLRHQRAQRLQLRERTATILTHERVEAERPPLVSRQFAVERLGGQVRGLVARETDQHRDVA